MYRSLNRGKWVVKRGVGEVGHQTPRFDDKIEDGGGSGTSHKKIRSLSV